MNAPSMYRDVMGDAFDQLAEPVRQFHTASGYHQFYGEVQVGAPVS